MATATVYIHDGDYDCSEMVRMCYRAVGILPYGSYMWTGNELELLQSHGFVKLDKYHPQMGDVLWRSGHTELYLGNNMQGGARIAETGGTDGDEGDQTGTEITKSAYKPDSWTYLLHYNGNLKVEGIPAPIAAALVAEHIIEHEAHGYSQPNRSGNGKVEAIKIRWDGDDISWIPTQKQFYFTFKQDTNVRTSPDNSTDDNLLKAKWRKGETAFFDGIAFGSGYIWGTYIGPTTKKRLFAAMGTHELGIV